LRSIQKMDSTTQLINRKNNQDKVDLMNSYAWEIRRLKPSKSLEIALEFFELSTEIGYEHGVASSLKNSGAAYCLLSIYDSSIVDLYKAKKIFKKLGDKKSESECLHYLGNIYCDLEDYVQAMELYEKAGTLAVEINDQNGIAVNLCRIGFVHYLCKRYNESHFYLKQSKVNLKNGGDEIVLIDVLINMGKIHFDKKKYPESYKYFSTASEISKKNNYLFGAASSLQNLGMYYKQIVENGYTESSLLEALQISEQIGEKGLAMKVALQLSDFYENISEFSKALQYYKKYDALIIDLQKNSNKHKVKILAAQFELDEIIKEEELLKINSDLSIFHKELEEKNSKLELLSLVASQSDHIIIIMDANGMVNFVNDSFVRFNDCGLEELKRMKGKTIFEISNYPKIREVFDECITRKKSVTYESLNVSQSGKRVWGSALLTPVFNVFGELTNFIIIDNDITERKLNAEIIDQKNRDITSSITYAKRIQEAILPEKSKIKQHFLDSFIINLPKDIVSGDFYWFDRIGDHVVFAVADCTGHGVPGAFMSMIGINSLTQIVNDSSVTNPARALECLDVKIKKALKQTGASHETTDGMDIAILEFSFLEKEFSESVQLNYAGAHRPLWIIRDNNLIEIEADKNSIGGGLEKENFFTNKTFQTKEGDVLYIFTDGCIALFGGEKGKKFSTGNLKKLLLSICHLPMIEQEKIITSALHDWKGDLEQVDDILIMGFKIK